MKKIIAALALAFIVGCGGTDSTTTDPTPIGYSCSIGSLTGTWRFHYTETNGNCGPISDETGILGVGSGSSSCTTAYKRISADQCRMDAEFTCPTTDQQGTVSWVLVLEQVSNVQITGSGTVQGIHPAGTCRSTYAITVTRL